MINKLIIVGSIIIGFIVVLCFYWGYTIPEFDKHKSWMLFPKGKNKEFIVEKLDLRLGDELRLMQFPTWDGYIIIDEDSNRNKLTRLVDEHFRIVKKLPKAHDVYIDSVNNRIIFENVAMDRREDAQYFSCDLKTLQVSGPLLIQNYPLKESLREFMTRKGLSKNSYESDEKDAYNAEYLKVNQQEVDFYNTLHPIKKINNSHGLNILAYADKSGKLYNIQDVNHLEGGLGEFWNSIYILFKNYDDDDITHYFIPDINFIEADKPTVSSNFLYVGVFFSPIEFRQWHLNYYSIKFGNKSFNFKNEDDDDIYLRQLNVPKNENDTLYMKANSDIYRVFLKSNRK